MKAASTYNWLFQMDNGEYLCKQLLNLHLSTVAGIEQPRGAPRRHRCVVHVSVVTSIVGVTQRQNVTHRALHVCHSTSGRCSGESIEIVAVATISGVTVVALSFDAIVTRNAVRLIVLS